MSKLSAVVLSVVFAFSAAAELQNVDIGGEIRIRARHWDNTYVSAINGPGEIQIPNFFLPGRAIGPFGTVSRYDWNSQKNDLGFVEQRTRLNVNADFTNEVRAFIELESFDIWGEDFRSNYVTGFDSRAVSSNDVEVYQAYIEANELFSFPLRLRIGRQEMKMGKGWLVDDITTAIMGRSFDAIRLTYSTDKIDVDAWWSKLADTSPLEQDGDTDFYGIYATYRAMDALSISAYWLLVRDAQRLNDTNFAAPIEWVENFLDLDNYDPTQMHTIGARLFGGVGRVDYDLEVAYQFGDAGRIGSGFVPNGQIYGDDDAEFDAWAGDLEVGYTFDIAWQPRVFIGGAYFEGEDNRALSFADWINPFFRPDASVSFNRLFPGKPYSLILEIGQDMSNFWQARGGAVVHPTDAVSSGLTIAYFAVDEAFDAPVAAAFGPFQIPIAPALSFWTEESNEEIGVSAHLWVNYQYSEDLYFKIGWEHLFTGQGLEDGSFLHRYGQEFSGGSGNDDADYLYMDIGLRF
ncbi:MAG: hypothetical protein AMXMBFR84_17020 [Candidatus Hydrogenedentota bacterium]